MRGLDDSLPRIASHRPNDLWSCRSFPGQSHVHSRVLLLALLLGGCLGVGDSLVVVEGRLVDQTGAPFGRCQADLRFADSKEELESVALDDRRLDEGRFSLSFHIPGRWADCYFTLACDGAAGEVSSPVVRRGYENPIQLGDIVLRRANQ